MRHGEVVEMEIPSAPEYVGIVRRAVEGIARRMEFQPGEVEDLKLAVGEACTNAVKYGCPRDDVHNVGIRCTVRSDGLMVEITNNISGCEVPSVPVHPNLDQVGGLGLFIIRKLVDEVDILWETETATIKMLKKLPVAAG